MAVVDRMEGGEIAVGGEKEVLTGATKCTGEAPPSPARRLPILLVYRS
jgi:hypothetical protein